MTDQPELSRRWLRATIDTAASAAVAFALLAGLIPILWHDDPADTSRPAVLAGFVVLLFEVFAFHGGLALLAIAALAGILKRLRFAAIFALLGLVFSGPGLASYFKQHPVPPAGAFTVLSVNTLYLSADMGAIEHIVEREKPDIIVLQEVFRDDASRILERFADAYPYTVAPISHKWGCLLLSRRPFLGHVESIPGHAKWPIDQPAARVEFEGRELIVAGVHLPAPNRTAQLAAGVAMAHAAADWVRAHLEAPGTTDGLILAGDFNAPLPTGRMRPLRDAGLREAHATAGVGRGATWPDKTPLRFAPGIRLDQVTFAGSLRCVDSRVLECVGSDHRPVLTRFVWE